MKRTQKIEIEVTSEVMVFEHDGRMIIRAYAIDDQDCIEVGGSSRTREELQRANPFNFELLEKVVFGTVKVSDARWARLIDLLWE